jgi:hypothetical protein
MFFIFFRRQRNVELERTLLRRHDSLGEIGHIETLAEELDMSLQKVHERANSAMLENMPSILKRKEKEKKKEEEKVILTWIMAPNLSLVEQLSGISLWLVTAYIKGCVLAMSKSMHCLSLITDLMLINCVDTND